jgi:hypothetical protein
MEHIATVCHLGRRRDRINSGASAHRAQTSAGFVLTTLFRGGQRRSRRWAPVAGSAPPGRRWRTETRGTRTGGGRGSHGSDCTGRLAGSGLPSGVRGWSALCGPPRRGVDMTRRPVEHKGWYGSHQPCCVPKGRLSPGCNTHTQAGQSRPVPGGTKTKEEAIMGCVLVSPIGQKIIWRILILHSRHSRREHCKRNWHRI